MRSRKLNTGNRIDTPNSGTTIYIDYSAEKQVLEISFNGGSIYQYKGVSALAWEEYKKIVFTGGSSGKFVNAKIKPFYLNFEQLE